MAKHDDKRAHRDVAGVGPDARQTRHLMPLKELDKLKIASGEPDIRGWRVFTSNGRKIGEVEDLLVDTSRNEVVMLDIDLDNTDRHSLAPIRAAWIDRDTKRVILDGAQFDAEEEIPSLSRTGDLSDDEVRTFGDRYRRSYGERAFGDEADDWRLRHRNDELHFGRPADLDDRERNRELVVERRPLREDDDSWRRASTGEDDVREVRLPSRDPLPGRVASDDERVVEEVVVRRRVVDAEEAARIEREERR